MTSEELREKANSLRRVVQYGIENGKKNIIADLDVLTALFRGEIPVGGNEFAPEDVSALLYNVKGQRDDEARMHAACLTIAETGQKWGENVKPSPAMEAVLRLRRSLEQIAVLAVDEGEAVCQGLAKEVLRWGEVGVPVVEREQLGEDCVPLAEFDTMAKEIKLQVLANHRLRAALLPFAAAAGRPGRLNDCMTDNPLSDDAVLALGVKVSAWKKAIELTGADDPPDCAFASPEDPRWEALGDNTAKPLACANCGEVSTNPGQFTPDGLWLCTEACRKELCEKQSYDDLRASGGIVDAP